MDGMIPQAVLDGVGVALSPLPVIAAIALLRTPRPLINSLSFVLGWVTHLAIMSVVLLAAVRGPGIPGGADLTRPLAVVLLAMGVLLMIGAVAAWRGRTDHAGRVRRWLGRLDKLSPRVVLLAGFLALSLNGKNTALTLSTVYGIERANAGVAESAAIIALFTVAGTLGVGAPLALYALLPDRASSLLDAWRLQLERHSRAIAAWALLGAGALLAISALLTLRG
jgi:Sap, sulfolipid-1-addressing protein